MLCPWVDRIEDLAGRWWVAHTRSRQEKALARDLHDRGVGYFLPMQSRTIVSGGRRRRVQKPFFPSYVFVCEGDDDRDAILKTNRVCQLMPVCDPKAMLAELSAIRGVLSDGAVIQHLPNLVEGSRCRVISGPLRGIEGPVVRIRGRSSIFLRLTVIGQGALVEIDPDLLEPVY